MILSNVSPWLEQVDQMWIPIGDGDSDRTSKRRWRWQQEQQKETEMAA
jgi:hypothetical protein